MPQQNAVGLVNRPISVAMGIRGMSKIRSFQLDTQIGGSVGSAGVIVCADGGHVVHRGVWRDPHEESEDYPGLVVHDGRVTGSITFGHSRLPLWCLVQTALTEGWETVEDNWPTINDYGWDERRLGEFLYYLLEMRGEFGRLLCILADAERVEWLELDKVEHVRTTPVKLPPAWWEIPEQRQRVRAQLRLCLETLDELERPK